MIAGQGGIKASQSYTDLLDTTKTLFDMVRRSAPAVRPVHLIADRMPCGSFV